MHGKLLKRCQALAEGPGMGRQRPDLGDEVQSWPEGNYIIFYRSNDEGIDVLRFLHGARDLDRLFEGPPHG